ncbi:flagellar L-ring protein [Limnochorda pilosa]|uniref:Flagellar L-ring protein n=1 Tax=Limnochorda pilosa TaxID=1555112 RepID=A0A0K2SP75_LIMPI|nr:flagellar L-ring protein [Limnochorda pilosa]
MARVLVAVSVVLVWPAGGADLAGRVEAQSLWPPEEPPTLFTDRRASRTGDLVTLVIEERTQGEQSAQTSTQNEHATDVSAGGLLAQWLPGLGLKAEQSGRGDGSTRRGSSLEARLTARVVEVTPDGNLRIEGTREIVINGERQKLTLSGLVRPADIRPDNTVLSSYLADARIELEGEGPVDALQHPGLLNDLFNWLF